jgi:hypothetical protein
MFSRSLFFFSALFFQTACTTFSRHETSGYSAHGPAQILVERNSMLSGTSTESSPDLKHRLKNMENTLRSKKEMEQYAKVVPYFKNETERLEFLALEDYEARQQWLADKNFPERSKQINDKMQGLVDTQDIAVGMPQPLVKKAWGEPEQVEIAGQPQLKNEKWRYSRYVSSTYGYKLEKKYVYFEAGKVVAWDTE